MTNASMLEGLYLCHNGKEYGFLRFYPDGEVYSAGVRSSSPRAEVIVSVRRWFERGEKAKNPCRIRHEDGTVTWEFTNDRKWSVRGQLDSIGRLVLIFRDEKTGLERPAVYSPLGEPGQVLPVFINAANADELTDLPSVGKGLATKVVAYRVQHGPFPTVDELLKVKGMSKAKLDACRSLCDARPVPDLGLTARPAPEVKVTQAVLAAALKEGLGPRVSEDISPLRKLGRYDVVYEVVLSHPSPLTVMSWGRGDIGFECRGRHVDDATLEAMLDAVSPIATEEIARLEGVRVLPLASQRFDRVVLVPGHLKSIHEPPLDRYVHRLYPAMRFEVADGMSIGAFTTLTSSSVGLHLGDWQREPQPLLRIRVVEPAPNCGFRAMKTRGLAKPGYVARMFAENLRSGTVEMWDIDERQVALYGEQDAIRICHADRDGRIPHVQLPEALACFLTGGSLDRWLDE
jgi:competence ComEA-like helix-hairpin-helix protein